MNRLYFGDNLDVLRESISPESVDLIYLDPPFNSNATYNVLFKARSGQPSEAQAEAFRDTWEWGKSAADAYQDVMEANGDLALVLSGFHQWLGQSRMMAYLAMMAVRFLELRRVLKSTGSLYLHCDPTASHYLKLILDAVFGHQNYINEIIWRRYKRPKGSQFKARKFGTSTDTIFFYTKSDAYRFHLDRIKILIDEDEIERRYNLSDEKGPYYSGPLLRSPAMGPRPNLVYAYKGFTPGPEGWRMTRDKLAALDHAGDMFFTSGGIPRRKVRMGERPGIIPDNLWADIEAIGSQAAERLHYPTQKPVPLLTRIIAASSDEGDLVLDPFCGCGTTVEAAERLGRQWIGIDVTHYAITLIESRLRSSEAKSPYVVEGRPTDLMGARDLFRRDPHQFQWWAAWQLGAQSYREAKRGADRGIDGNIFFPNGPYGTGRIIISVKGGENIGPQFVRELRGTVERENAAMGILITLGEPTRAMIADAAAGGFVVKSVHGRLPRIQIATIEDILNHRLPVMPKILEHERAPVPAARHRKAKRQIEMLLPISGQQIPHKKGDFIDPRLLDLAGAAD